MTTIDAAAAWQRLKPITRAILAAAFAVTLAGCETGTSIFGSSASDPSTDVAGQPSTAIAGQSAKMAVAPVIGPPENVAKQLQTQMAASLEKQKISVAKQPTDKAEYTLRGYVVSANEKGKTKVSYIWDVTAPDGRKVNRITGEEVANAPGGADPWAAVTPQVVDAIVGRTSTQVMAWLPTQSAPAVAAVPGAVAPAAPGAAGAPRVANTPAGASPAPVAQAPAQPGSPTTGSIGRDQAATMVPSVVGAPGDGSVALTGALQRQLQKNGVALTDKQGQQTYRVEGKVTVGQAKDGKQPITIDWMVKDPTGKKLGTVSQKNEIAQGSLDGAWGPTADAIAEAAAKGIVKLLPQRQASLN